MEVSVQNPWTAAPASSSVNRRGGRPSYFFFMTKPTTSGRAGALRRLPRGVPGVDIGPRLLTSSQETGSMAPPPHACLSSRQHQSMVRGALMYEYYGVASVRWLELWVSVSGDRQTYLIKRVVEILHGKVWMLS